MKSMSHTLTATCSLLRESGESKKLPSAQAADKTENKLLTGWTAVALQRERTSKRRRVIKSQNLGRPCWTKLGASWRKEPSPRVFVVKISGGLLTKRETSC
jgi:hypothetical protein